MRYECVSYDPQHYATNLRFDKKNNRLNWETAQGQDVLIIQTPFGVAADDHLDAICQELNKGAAMTGDYREILPHISARYITAAEKAKAGGTKLNGEASTYSVFAVSSEGDLTRIYRQKSGQMISPTVDIPLEIHVRLEKGTVMKGFLFHKKQVENGFYRIYFQGKHPGGYAPGSLYCRVEDFEVPVTTRMLEAGIVYVQSEEKPVLISRNKGLEIVYDEMRKD